MRRHVYSEINLHMTWHVLESQPIITENIEDRLHRYILSYALQSKGVIVHKVDGTETHIHMAVTVPPTLLVSDWIGKIKGASSHYVNQELVNRKLLDWQVGYGVVSFGTRDLPSVVDYIANQKAHHARGTTHERLERIDQED
jgi:putative transposase